MENSFQTSFIPKKPIVPNKTKEKKTKSLFLLITTTLLIISGVISVGLYVYKSQLVESRTSRSQSLSTIRSNFEENTIEELSLYNKKMETAKMVLKNHVVLSPLFSLLSEITIPEVQYNSFKHESEDKVLTVKLEGLALDYRSIALQANMFNDSRNVYFKNVLFSNLNKDTNNNVKFNLEFEVDPSLISYENNGLSMFEKDETTEGTKEVVPQTEATLPEEILPDNNEAETE
jgi:hypothetical protein